MGKQIRLQTCFALPGFDAEFIDLPEGVNSIAELLQHMGKEIDFGFIDPDSGDLGEDIELILNGKEIWFYPDALNSRLHNGDRLELYLLPLGGG